MVTQRKQAQPERASLLTQGPRHVSCHATVTPSTQIRADGGNKAKKQRRDESREEQSPPSDGVKARGGDIVRHLEEVTKRLQ